MDYRTWTNASGFPSKCGRKYCLGNGPKAGSPDILEVIRTEKMITDVSVGIFSAASL